MADQPTLRPKDGLPWPQGALVEAPRQFEAVVVQPHVHHQPSLMAEDPEGRAQDGSDEDFCCTRSLFSD